MVDTLRLSLFLIHSSVAVIIIFFILGLKRKYAAVVILLYAYAYSTTGCSSGTFPSLLMGQRQDGINKIQYNTIQYKTYNAPYVTKMLFVGAGMTRD